MTIVVPELSAEISYSGADGCATWAGYAVNDDAYFRAFLAGPVADRAGDRVASEAWEEEVRQLASTDTSPEFLAEFFAATPDDEDWELGEAFAETILAKDMEREVRWPWNNVRDRKTPRASLPGADLVGFVRDDDGYALLLGEVKTSQDQNTPPGVMYGTKGMHWQLHRNATELTIQHSLWKWLSARCQTPELQEAYRSALRRYLRSSGQDIVLAGVLCRDTLPAEKDLSGRAANLGNELVDPTRVEFTAWYLPVSIDEWTTIAGGGS